MMTDTDPWDNGICYSHRICIYIGAITRHRETYGDQEKGIHYV